MGDYTTTVKVKNYLGISAATWDTLFDYLVMRMSDFIRNYTGREFDQTTYTDQRYDGTEGNGGILRTKQFPIISVTSLYDDPDRSFAAASLIDTSNYVVYLDEGIVQLVDRPTTVQADRTTDPIQFNVGFQNIKITYVAGYVTIPTDIDQACIDLVANKFNLRQSGGKKAEKLGRWSVTYVTSGGIEAGIPIDTLTTLNKYKMKDMVVL